MPWMVIRVEHVQSIITITALLFIVHSLMHSHAVAGAIARPGRFERLYIEAQATCLRSVPWIVLDRGKSCVGSLPIGRASASSFTF